MQEADRRMESAGEIPFSSQEIEAMVRRATTDPTPPPRIRVTSRRTVWKQLAALLLAAAILFGCLLMMSVSSGTLLAPQRPSDLSTIEAERSATLAAMLARLELRALPR